MKTTDTKKKIGILGGSFDPIHKGHLNIAESARKEFQLDEVWFIPAGHSPNKDETCMTSAAERAKMVQLAIEDYPYFRLSTLEIDSTQTSYTSVTLTKLNTMYPDTQFYFIMGADSLDYLESWHHPEIICENAILLVAVRGELGLAELKRKSKELQKMFRAEIHLILGGKTNISSTELRAGKGGMHAALLPEKVADYILKQGLYGYGEKRDSQAIKEKTG
ncbi:MAG: nicotinate-nucleotide adenylyltransferase [Clostridiales bacterium]|nr:nicotinate-nucleotide adenylyltransferase [Clostridiales bacterium]